MNLSDSHLEARIVIAYQMAMASKRRQDWERLAELIKQRSPEVVRAMEREKGLA